MTMKIMPPFIAPFFNRNRMAWPLQFQLLFAGAAVGPRVSAEPRSAERTAPPALDQTPAPHHFPVAALPVRSDDWKNDEWLSPRTRHVVAGHCGILAPLPGIDRRPSKQETKCVNHFSINMVSQLNWTHPVANCVKGELCSTIAGTDTFLLHRVHELIIIHGLFRRRPIVRRAPVAKFCHAFEHGFLVGGVTFHRDDEIRNKIVAAFQFRVHVAPRYADVISQIDERVVLNQYKDDWRQDDD